MTGDNPAHGNNTLPSGKHLAPSREQITALTTEIGKLQVFADRVTKQREDDRNLVRRLRNLIRFDIGFSVILFAVGILLTVFFIHDRAVATELQQQNTQLLAQQKQIIAQQTRETATRDQALCPLYGLLLGSYNPKSRLAYPHGPDAYDAAFATLRKATAALTCAN